MNEQPGDAGDDAEGESLDADSDTNARETEAWAAWERAESAAQNETEHASIMMFNLAREGQLAASLSVAQTLRSKPLSADVGRRADVVIGRLWASRVQLRPDVEARQAADQLLADPGELNPWQRTLLHLNIAACIQVDLNADLDDIDVAVEHLVAALALVKTIGSRGLEVTALSRLALAQVSLGRPSGAGELAQAALDLGGVHLEDTLGSTPFWMVRSQLVLAWAAAYQTIPYDWSRLPDLRVMRSEAASDPALLALSTQLTVQVALKTGNMHVARTALGHATADTRIIQGKVWSPPLIVFDAFLAISQGDRTRAHVHLAKLVQLPAPAEAALVAAMIAGHRGDLAEAVELLGAITSGAVRPVGMTFATGNVYEAGLLEVLGRHAEADASMQQALAWTEPINARAVFPVLLPGPTLALARRAASAYPDNLWAADVVAYIEAAVRQAEVVPGEGDPGRLAPTRAVDTPLTPRELEVLALFSGGSSQSEIARDLYVSLNTVKTHLRSIRQKLGVARTGEAAALARSAGWL